jgi:hypothetical protein
MCVWGEERQIMAEAGHVRRIGRQRDNIERVADHMLKPQAYLGIALYSDSER